MCVVCVAENCDLYLVAKLSRLYLTLPAGWMMMMMTICSAPLTYTVDKNNGAL